MKRKTLFLGATLLLAGVLSACGGNGKKEYPDVEPTEYGNAELQGEYNVRVWVAEAVVGTTQAQLAALDELFVEGIKVNWTVEPVGEGDAAGQMIKDVEEGADIYGFAQDQLARLRTAGALSEIKGTMKENISKRNDEGSVKAATLSNALVAFPMTSDNGYFMYYNKSVINEKHLGNMTNLIADCKAANKFFAFNGSSAWYNAAFFFGTGCESTWETDAAGEFTSYVDTYNSANGLKALKGMKELITSGVYTDSSTAAASFESGAAIVVSGTWDSAAAKKALGENYGVAELPSFKVDGKSYHLGSFGGYKLLGVKPQQDAKKAAICQLTASYLTSATCQLQKYNAHGWGPSNLKAQRNEAVQSDAALVALGKQSAYAIPQGQYPGKWWDTAGALGSDVLTLGAGATDAQLQKLLTDYAAALPGMLKQ